ELAGAREIVAEGLLEDDARPRAAGALLPVRRDEVRPAEALDDGLELGRRDGEVKEPIFPGAALGVEPLEVLLEGRVGRRVVRGAAHPRDATLEVGPDDRVDGLAAREGRDGLLHLGAERVVALLAPRDADDREAAGQRARPRQVVERGHELAAREVPGRA